MQTQHLHLRNAVILAIAAATLTLSGAWAQPVIRGENGVLNASSYQADIARGSWFVIFGSNMGPASISIHTGALPFPTSLSGTSVSVTPAAGGTAIACRLWYTLAGQIAALLPSTVAAGDYDVKITYNNQTSGGYRIKIVERNFGFATATQNGSGVPQATNASLNGGVSLVRFTSGSISFSGRNWPYRPAYPGETLILWGTGLGADSQSDDTGATSGDQTAAGNIRVLVGGVEITPAFAGRSSGSPGLDQINFTMPANVPLGCTVSLQVLAGGRYSNLGTLPVSRSGDSDCQHPYLTQAQLQSLDGGGTQIIGGFTLVRTTISLSVPGIGSFETTSENVGGSFSKYTSDQVAFVGGVSVAQIGSCYAVRLRGTTQEALQGIVRGAADAGTPLLLNGPNASGKPVPRGSGNSYNLDLYFSGVAGIGATGSPTLAGGTYTLAGTGGAEIGSFTSQIPFPAGFDWTNRSGISAIARNQPLAVRWSGGGTEADATVNIVGLSGTQVGGDSQNPIYESSLFVCTAPASVGNFTVPGSVTGYLSPVAAGSTTGLGLLTVAASNTTKFTAPIVAGGTAPGELGYTWSYSKNLAVQ